MKKRATLILGDLLVSGVVTLTGFATHGELSLASLPRMLTTFLPLLAGWFLAAPWLGLFDPQKYTYSIFWRVPMAMLLAVPLTSILRAALLDESAIPQFTLVLGGSATVGMLIWRGLWVWINRPKKVEG
jgi:hypothetical protein